MLGAAGHLLVQLPSLAPDRRRIRPRVDLADAEARKALVLMAPRALGLGATQLVFLVMTSLASTLGDGLDRGVQLRVRGPPDPDRRDRRAARASSSSRRCRARPRRGATDAFPRLLVRGLAMLAFVMIADRGARDRRVARTSTRLLFGYGPIGEPRARADARTLAVFLVGLTAHSLIAVARAGVLRAPGHATPVAAALLASSSTSSSRTSLVGPLGLAGLAAAIAVAAWLEPLVLVVLLRAGASRASGSGIVAVVMREGARRIGVGAAVAWLV